MKSPSPDILFNRRYICPSASHRVSRDPKDYRNMSWGGTLRKGATKVWKGGGHNVPQSPTSGDFGFPSRLPPAFRSRRCLHWGGTCTQHQATGDGTHTVAPQGCVQPPPPSPDLLGYKSRPDLVLPLPGEREDRGRRPLRSSPPRASLPLVQKESALIRAPLPER